MKQAIPVFACFLAITIGAPAVHGQQSDDTARITTRERLSQLLTKVGPEIHVSFSQSQKQPFNYAGILRDGLVNAESFEIVLSITPSQTISLRVFPHYKAGYINLNKARDSDALMRLLLRLSDRTFLFWGTDASDDVFAGFTFTMESGFPEAAIDIVLRSIVNSDRFVGELRPAIDGTTAP